MLTSEQRAEYQANGYCVMPALLNDPEVTMFRDTARQELTDVDADGLMEKTDAEGNTTLLKLWHSADDNVYGYVVRDERLVAIARELIGPDAYVYSHKMTMKNPHRGGAWEWHQDYGYWYQNKCLAPDMMSIWIALDPSHASNGCLQVLRRSHSLGRLDHRRVDGQTVVDAEYLDAALERFELVHVEMEPGDALVFHCNLLHRSDANTSDSPRWGYIASYNTAANTPFRDVREYGHYQELVPVPAGTFAAGITRRDARAARGSG